MSATAPRRGPAQKRSMITFESILDAAAVLLTRDGYEALSTARIAELTGVRVGCGSFLG